MPHMNDFLCEIQSDETLGAEIFEELQELIQEINEQEA